MSMRSLETIQSKSDAIQVPLQMISQTTSDRLLARDLMCSLVLPVLMTFKIKLTRFERLERSLRLLKNVNNEVKVHVNNEVEIAFSDLIHCNNQDFEE